MALPTLKTLGECANFSKTVEPFIPQLYELPQKLFEVISRREGFLDLYLETNPLITGFATSIVLGAVFLVAAEVNRNYSQVDRFWSLLPTFYIAHFNLWARLSGTPSERLDVVLIFSTFWSARLTYNYWRKGGYSIGSEDYRWAIIRRQMPAWAFHLLNWTFISFIQSVLLFSLTAPVYIILLSTQFESKISHADAGYLAAELSLILVEVLADHQQWVYQNAKALYQKSAKVPQGYKQASLDLGFITSGLWAYSRHPNFAAEQAIWFFVYHWGTYASKSLYNWTLTGPCVLFMVFQGSTWLTEVISSSKYPEYPEYQRQVGMFVPMGFSSFKIPVVEPKVIRTSELAKNQSQKRK